MSGAPRHKPLTWEDPARLAFWTAEEVRLSPAEDRGALPAVYEAVTTASGRGTGVIIEVG